MQWSVVHRWHRREVCLEVVTNAHGNGSLERVGRGSRDGRCARQGCSGLIRVTLVDIAVGCIQRGSFAQRVLIANTPEADRVVVPGVVVVDCRVGVIYGYDVFWCNRSGYAQMPLFTVICCHAGILCITDRAVSTADSGDAEVVRSREVPGVSGIRARYARIVLCFVVFIGRAGNKGAIGVMDGCGKNTVVAGSAGRGGR